VGCIVEKFDPVIFDSVFLYCIGPWISAIQRKSKFKESRPHILDFGRLWDGS